MSHATQKPDLLVRVSSLVLKTVVFASGKWNRRSFLNGHSFIAPWWKWLGLCKVPENIMRPDLYGQLRTEKSLRVWQEAVFLMGGWKNAIESVADYPTVKLKGSFFLTFTEMLTIVWDRALALAKKTSRCLFCQWSKHFFLGVFYTSFTCQIWL